MKTATESARVHIRWLIMRDFPEVLAIEADCFGSHAWAEEDFRRVLRERNCIGMVAEIGVGATIGETIVGFMLFALEKDRLEVLNFAVHADYRRRGVGSQLVAKLRSKLSSHRRNRLALVVPETNLDAQLFFRWQGFEATGVLRDHFADADGYRMVYRLDARAL